MMNDADVDAIFTICDFVMKIPDGYDDDTF